MRFKNKSFLIYGVGQSGIFATKLLLKKGAKVFVFDDNYSAVKNLNENKAQIVKKLTKKIILNVDCIIVSPAVDFYNSHLVFARKIGKEIISELELGFLCTKNKIVAITGTNGKTTTVRLVNEILNTQRKVLAVGNVGYPVTRAVFEKFKGIFVTEVSSFMLENIHRFKPFIATVTNITSDHLDRHFDMENYSKIKLEIFRNFSKNSFAVVNLDDKSKDKILNMNFKKDTYSVKNENADAYLKNDEIILNKKPFIKTADIKLRGIHNYYNVLCAVLIAKQFKIKNKNIKKILKEFTADSHRFEFVDKINNITFIDDSKSTNIDSTLKACSSVENETVLLLGGYDKNLNYDELFLNLPVKIVNVVAYGRIKEILISSAQKAGFKNIIASANLKTAFSKALEVTKPNQTILLSPATSSFDEFENYKQRGETFVKLVKEYKAKK